ncbi:hypothetical protein GGU10DRAFT_388690 [Lentinula aff. detonsa]|uniref:ARM repeat-containing protein n=1 Tax=Lentinula aff. detonsa TaxID=2804958 RepID=A0AA38KFD6_9AGAR|nr:hypothetical protein GGU10DRAFT_388690 [Lentinula aff. detonsa]
MAIIASSSPSSLPSSSRLPLSSPSELKQLKNQIIGTPSAKCRLAKDRATMRMLVETTMETMAADDVRTETAQILGSLASLGGHADDAVVISALIEQDALRCCLSALSTTINVKKKKLRLALTRALSAISGNLSELVGPPQWGLGSFEAQWLTGPAAQTLEWFFSPEAMDIWIPMLSGGEAGVVAGMIGTIVRTQPVRERLCAWRNADEREKKERRGWEATRPSTSGSYVIRTLLELTEKKETLGNALFALAALAKDNSAVATELPLQDIVNYAKARSGEIQLSGCLCATNILRTSPGPSLAADAILSVLMAIIASGTAHSAKAAFVLSQLLTDSAVYAQLAFEHGALRVLLTTLRRLTPPLPSLPSLPPLHPPTSSLFTGPEWESWLELELDQPKADIHLREAILLSLASISLFSIDIRRALAEEEGETQSTSSKDSSQLRASLASPSFHQSQSSLSLILAGLLSPHTSLRSAACHVVRALTRSVAVIRTNIVDSGLGWVVFATFMGWPQARPRTTLGASGSEEEDVRVVASALRAVCNAVCEFSPLSKIYVEHGLLFRLAEFIHPNHPFAEAASDADTEDSLRFNSLWAVKNLVRKSSPDRKRQIISVLGWHQPKISSHSESVPDYNEQRKRSRLDDLLSSPSSKISEQVFNILRNIAEDEDGIPIVFNELDIRHPSFSPSTPLNPLFLSSSSSSSSSGFLLLSHLMSILTSSSSHTSSPHVSHTSYSSTQDVLIQAASLLANLVNSSDLKHHRMILNYPGMANALRRVLAEQGPEVRRPVIRAILEMVKVDLGVSYTSVAGVREVGQFKDEEGEEGMGMEMEMEIGNNTEVIQEEDGEGDADVMEIGHGTGRPVVDMVMNPSHTGTERTRTYSHSRNQGLTGARKILIDAGFVGTLHRIIDQHHHHSSLAHTHTHSHLHPHSSAVFPGGHGHIGSAAGVHNHAHVHAHGSFGSSSTLHHHHFGSLDNSGAGPVRSGGGNVGSISIGGGIMGNSGREDHEDLETARMALDWLEHGDMYVIHRRSASRNAGARSSSVSTRDSSADVSDH